MHTRMLVHAHRTGCICGCALPPQVYTHASVRKYTKAHVGTIMCARAGFFQPLALAGEVSDLLPPLYALYALVGPLVASVRFSAVTVRCAQACTKCTRDPREVRVQKTTGVVMFLVQVRHSVLVMES